jgi:glycosyltransferase involved in cell wall biosynthesis
MAFSIDSGAKEVDTRPIRVAFVVHVMQVAGAEMLVSETIRATAGEVKPTIVCLDAVGMLGEQLRSEGLEVVCLGRRPGRDFRAAGRMAGVIRRRKIEVVHAHQYTPFFYSALGASLSGRRPRIILTEHGRHFPDVVSPVRRAANRLVLARLAAEVNAVSAFSAEALRSLDGFSGRPVGVIENGVHVDRYGPAPDRAKARERLGLAPDRLYVANVARLHPIKDQPMLLRAFAEVAAGRPDVDLLLVGDGPMRGELEALAGTLGIADRVRFLGVRHDVPEILGVVDVFALTSISEAASLTLIEAMASRLPVVVTDVGGNPELARDGREGRLVPRGDAPAMARALLEVLDHPEFGSALGAAGQERARQKYRIGRTVDEYHRLYRRLSGRGDA